ncbi:MAG: DNA mismatch repair endonuclease MutL [Candidatus Binatus sp.]|uniref:DNA mismatch repair endonuclease MutL n=1 Tax=Candidatus Binatus sp. TaxID=2811406 RepID=UPI00271A37A5|nr:DNA mismatch repair endonuclease MutL [Candidatus Binatus sp.]MDO8433096.1 DNA mismatch repair endonuclease MutL [Candidatus Binatus sp.]
MAEHVVHILPEQVASQIAAGEVVERPASAVKELIENSLDAGARAISVEIERGGVALIAVGDDGCGMTREDAILSLRRHATSKIRSAADLTAIRTLGFRGEALASIASVSHLKLQTRRAIDANGVELTADGGNIDDTRECAMAAGTRIEVRELFFNTPARLKFLKTLATEQGAIADAFQRIALANHHVAFVLIADQRKIFELPRAASPLERVRQLFGSKLAGSLLRFELDRPGLRARGLAAASNESFATGRMIFTFVNGRSVRDRILIRAIEQAYQTLIPRGRHPAAVLFVDIRPEDVDVNVHPMKTEVRFRNSGAVFEAVYHAVRDRLADQTDSNAAATSKANQAPGDVAMGLITMSTASEEQAASNEPRESSPSSPHSRSDAPLRLVPDAPRPAAFQRPLSLAYDRDDRPTTANTPATAQIPMYSQLRVIGQIFAGYIALESDDGLILIDQHAAHERVTFERLRAELRDGGVRVQQMLAPVPVELNPARAAQIQNAVGELRAMGFDLEPFGPTTLLLKGAPAVFGPEGGARLLADMIDSLGEAGFRGGKEDAFETWLKQLACHGSVRVGRVLEAAEIHSLLAELDRTEFKTNCPHGRPVHINFGRGQIERMFRR